MMSRTGRRSRVGRLVILAAFSVVSVTSLMYGLGASRGTAPPGTFLGSGASPGDFLRASAEITDTGGIDLVKRNGDFLDEGTDYGVWIGSHEFHLVFADALGHGDEIVVEGTHGGVGHHSVHLTFSN